MDYTLLLEFFQKYFVVYEQSAVENSYSTYVCYTPDGLFWLNLYSAVNEYILKIEVQNLHLKDDDSKIKLRNILDFEAVAYFPSIL